jgi:hypothetical protein
MNRIPQLSLALLIAGTCVIGAGCNKRDEATSAGTPSTTTTPADTSATMPTAPASAASQ